MEYIRTYKAEIAVVLLSLILHTLLFVVMWREYGSVLNISRVDDGYFELAENVLAGNGFSWSDEAPYVPNSLRTPGYIYPLAFFIGLIGIPGTAILQLILSSLIPLFGMYSAKRIAGSERIALATGILLALDPTLALLSHQFYTDTFFLLLFLPWLFVTLRYSTDPRIGFLILSAVLLGVSILVRPVAQYIPFFILLCILFHHGKNWRTSILHIGIYFTIIGAILAPWIVRNTMTFGVPVLSTQTSFVLYTNLAPAVKSVAEGTDFLTTRDAFLSPEEYRGDAITPENAGVYKEKALQIIMEYPTATLHVMMRSLFTFFTIDGFYSFFVQLGHEPRDFLLFIIGARLFWVFVTVLGVLGACVYLLKNRTPWAFMFVFLIAYFALTSTIAGFGTNPRYRLPVDPLILALAGIGVHTLLVWLQKFEVIKSLGRTLREKLEHRGLPH